MQTNRSKRNDVMLLAGLLAAISIASLAYANSSTDLSGQWVGSSQVDGASKAARTTLVIGAADTENSSLRIEGDRTCTLKQGKYSASDNDGQTLTFKQANGGESCERLAKGTFTIRAGSAPRSLQFEAAYPDANGGQNLRRGALTRYP